MKFRIIIVSLIFTNVSFSQIGFQTSFKPNEITPGIYVGGDVSSIYSFQWNLLSADFIPNDPYNSNKFSGSMYFPSSNFDIQISSLPSDLSV